MIKIVRKNAIPISTWFGGTCWSESALLTKSSTMDTRRKLVIKMMMLGASDSTVRSNKSWRLNATSWPFAGLRTLMSNIPIEGIPPGVGISIVPSTDLPGKVSAWEYAGLGINKPQSAMSAAITGILCLTLPPLDPLSALADIFCARYAGLNLKTHAAKNRFKIQNPAGAQPRAFFGIIKEHRVQNIRLINIAD